VTKLVDILKAPADIVNLSLNSLSTIIEEARYFNMLAQLRTICEQKNIWAELPEKCQQHITSASYTFTAQQQKLNDEADVIFNILAPMDIEWVYLKGAAYHLSGFSEFSGRLMGDIDILVSKHSLEQVEAALRSHGWIQTHTNDYDEKFYREWSQEIPPLRHFERGTELDVHFNILPNTLRESPDPKYLMSQTVNLSSTSHYAQVLTPPAMVMHSAIHLFYESEFHKGLRDLYDLYLLFSKFDNDTNFWEEMMVLQKTIGNADSMFYALRYCQSSFGLTIPTDVSNYYDEYKPTTIKLFVADFAFTRIFNNMFPPNRKYGHQLAETILYIRGHMKRMPLHLLVPHLIKKSIHKIVNKECPKEPIF